LAEVRFQEGDALENVLRRFPSKVQEEDVIEEVQRHSFSLTPGEREACPGSICTQTQQEKARKEQD